MMLYIFINFSTFFQVIIFYKFLILLSLDLISLFVIILNGNYIWIRELKREVNLGKFLEGTELLCMRENNFYYLQYVLQLLSKI